MAAPKGSQGIEARVRALALEVVGRAGYELVDVEYRREAAGWTLRLFIDKRGGVTLGDCQKVSQEFGTVLEVEDPIPHRFNLEVSSPGLDRPLTRAGDVLAAQGRRIRVVTTEPLSGQRSFTGRLLRAGSEPGGEPPAAAREPVARFPRHLTLHVRDDSGVEHTIPGCAVEKARLIYEWPEATARQRRKSGRKR